MKITYSIHLTPPAPTEAPKKLIEYTYSEFWLDLAPHWRQIPTSNENTLNFLSDLDGSFIVVSADFYEIPDEKAVPIAQKCIDSRIEALELLHPGQVEVLARSIKPHSSGTGLELSFGADLACKHIAMYLGYVTSRKILNFQMTCEADRQPAARLFNETIQNFRPKLP